MSPARAARAVREKIVRDRDTGGPWLGDVPGRQEAAGESRERKGRRAGMLLIVIGCLLMAFAAGEAAADAGPGEKRYASAQASPGILGNPVMMRDR